MSFYKTRLFARFARRERIDDRVLREAADRADRGLIDADLGGGLIKQRVARTGQGRRGGYRVLIAFRTAERLVYLFGFAKNERENIHSDELAKVRVVAEYWLAADEAMIAMALREGLLIEVDDGN